MHARTLFLSKLLGLYCILTALALASHRQLTLACIATLLHTPSLMFLLGVFTTLGGLALVLAHNVWRGGSLTLAITVIAWLSLAKGLSFLLLPPDAAANLYLNVLHYAQFFYLWMALVFLLGAWLTWGGFTAAPRSA